MSLILILGLLIALSLHFTVGQIGVDYGRNGRGLPPPSEVVGLYKKYGIQRMRIYDTDPGTLAAVCGSDIELTVGIENPNLENIAACPANAEAWVRDNIRKYPDIKFRHIVVGNEVSPNNNGTSQYVPFVLPAIQNVYHAICAAGLDGIIKVTTAIDTEVLEPTQSDSPEDGKFRSNVTPYLNPIIRFLMETDSPLFANIYPYFSYISDPSKYNISYALLDPCYQGYLTKDGVRYQNLYQAILDAVYAALEKSVSSTFFTDATGGNSPKVNGGESGWPSGGGHHHKSKIIINDDDLQDVDVDVATILNAKTYVNNLVQAVKKGTPKRPGQPIETYIFAMFDEDLKPGDDTEKHLGLFYPSAQPKYHVNFN